MEKNIYIKVYYQINSMELETDFMKYVGTLNPDFLSFSSFEMVIDPSVVKIQSILDKFSSLIDIAHDSVIVLYTKDDEDYVVDLGIKMKIEYS